jgi:hypothetical protein
MSSFGNKLFQLRPFMRPEEALEAAAPSEQA